MIKLTTHQVCQWLYGQAWPQVWRHDLPQTSPSWIESGTYSPLRFHTSSCRRRWSVSRRSPVWWSSTQGRRSPLSAPGRRSPEGARWSYIEPSPYPSCTCDHEAYCARYLNLLDSRNSATQYIVFHTMYSEY